MGAEIVPRVVVLVSPLVSVLMAPTKEVNWVCAVPALGESTVPTNEPRPV